MSPTKARNGSMVTLMDASRIHRVPAATHRAGEFGMAIRAKVVQMAPKKK